MATATTLRHRLRADTRAAHDRLDRMAAGFDLSQRAGYGRFIRGHALATADLLGQGAELGLLRHRLALANGDLSAMGMAPVPARPDTPPGDGAPSLGLRYVIAGSHLGARGLVQAGRPSALLTDPALADHWAALVAVLKARPATGAAADQVVAQARGVFDSYACAFRRAAAG